MLGKIVLACTLMSAAHVCFACSCIAKEVYARPEAVALLVPGADLIVHARVKSMQHSAHATIEVIELFKGPAKTRTLKAKRGASMSCGTNFKVGEEAIFFSYQGVVDLCGKVRPDAAILEALRQHSQRVK